jgi:hypothetical protein
MTRKEKLNVINTVKNIVTLELRETKADILDIKSVEQICDTNHMRRITAKDVRSIANVIRYARRQVEKMAVTERTLEAITTIQEFGMWFCGKFDLSYAYMD